MKGIGTKEIETERLIMRRMSIDDAEMIYKNWTSDPLTARYVTWDKHENLVTTKEYVAFKAVNYDDNFFFDWVVELKETGELIGEIDAVGGSIKDKTVEVGYCYGSRFWNKGYASEALTAFIKYMFEEVGAEKVFAKHISTNPASGRVMQKAGMSYDATLKGYVIDKNTGRREDLFCYSIDKL
ncbi:MAG: GNAT family N-acetyltransferase [Ruminococcaceae bacterium]|nr:GNAT family N-acetyltransferase [Oscillospiraceae bacterium]